MKSEALNSDCASDLCVLLVALVSLLSPSLSLSRWLDFAIVVCDVFSGREEICVTSTFLYNTVGPSAYLTF